MFERVHRLDAIEAAQNRNTALIRIGARGTGLGDRRRERCTGLQPAGFGNGLKALPTQRVTAIFWSNIFFR